MDDDQTLPLEQVYRGAIANAADATRIGDVDAAHRWLMVAAEADRLASPGD